MFPVRHSLFNKQQILSSHHALRNNTPSNPRRDITMSSDAPPIPLHSKPTKFGPDPATNQHSCGICQDVTRFPIRPNRCPYTGGDITHKFGKEAIKFQFDEDDDESDVPKRVLECHILDTIYRHSSKAQIVSRWIVYCASRRCAGFSQGFKIDNETEIAPDC
jgi:hypothetical protein